MIDYSNRVLDTEANYIILYSKRTKLHGFRFRS